MRMRVGIAIGWHSVRAVVTKDSAIVWSGEESYDEASILEDALARLLARTPRDLAAHPQVVIAIGPSHAQIRRLVGLPQIRDHATLTRAVAGNAIQFFPDGERLVTTNVHRDASGNVSCAAFDREVVHAAVRGVRSSDVSVRHVAATSDLLSLLLPNESISWRDGEVAMTVSRVSGEVTYHRARIEPGSPATPPVTAAPALDRETWRFADAYAAAMIEGATFVWRPDHDLEEVARRWRRGVGALAAAAFVVGMAAYTAPALHALATQHQTEKALANLADRRGDAGRVEGALRAVTSDINQARDFEDRRSSITSLLGAIASALPESTAIVDLRIDSTGGSFTVLALRAEDIAGRLAGISALHDLRMVGPMTREAHGAESLERAAFRFRSASADVAKPPAAISK